MATDGEDQPMILHSVQASTWGAIRVANDAYPATTAEARSVGLPSDSEVLVYAGVMPVSDQERERLRLRLDLLRRL